MMSQGKEITPQVSDFFGPLAKVPVETIPVDEMQTALSATCGSHDVIPASTKTDMLRGSIVERQTPFFGLSVVSTDAKSVERGLKLIRRDPGDHLYLLIQDKGNCLVRQNETALYARPGDMFLVDSAKPVEMIYDGRLSQQVSIHLPREESLFRYGAHCTGGTPIDRTDPLFLAIRAVIAKIISRDFQHTPQLSEAFHNLLGSYFQSRAIEAGQESAAKNTLLSRALNVIEMRCEDDRFNVSELADDLGVSQRTLQRQFSEISETARDRILSCRLQKARARLDAVRHGQSGDSITSIAFGSGFSDLSYFYRAFRGAFGQTPGDYAKGGG